MRHRRALCAPGAPRRRPTLLFGLSECIRHRGPDGSATWYRQDGRVGLGHRRLSIIDLDGRRPPADASRTAPSASSSTARSTTIASGAVASSGRHRPFVPGHPITLTPKRSSAAASTGGGASTVVHQAARHVRVRLMGRPGGVARCGWCAIGLASSRWGSCGIDSRQDRHSPRRSRRCSKCRANAAPSTRRGAVSLPVLYDDEPADATRPCSTASRRWPPDSNRVVRIGMDGSVKQQTLLGRLGRRAADHEDREIRRRTGRDGSRSTGCAPRFALRKRRCAATCRSACFCRRASIHRSWPAPP